MSVEDSLASEKETTKATGATSGLGSAEIKNLAEVSDMMRRLTSDSDDNSADAPPEIDLTSPEYYLNRELTWLQFNERVLHEAEDDRNPILERAKFLSITASNLDEFFMKRIGGLKQQLGAGVHDLTVDGRSPKQQISECLDQILNIEQSVRDAFKDILEELGKNNIRLYGPERYKDLSLADRDALQEIYVKELFPLITPLAMDPAHPFPHISNLSLNLLVSLRVPEEDNAKLVRIKVPTGPGLSRFIQVPGTDKYVSIEAVIANNLEDLFPDTEICSVELFRVIRNANTERSEEHADDLLAMIELELRDRKFAPIVRVEISAGMDPVHRGMLAAELGLDEKTDVSESKTMLAVRDLMEISGLDLPELHDEGHHAINNTRLMDDRSIFHNIREAGSIFLQHPYESFATSVERFVREASKDPKVLAIKMTIYRTSLGTGIIDSLIEAARNGKQVTVVVELKARFDEEANIKWARRLEEEGIHATYGVIGLKTHCKAIMVVRRDYDGLRRYVHTGTGNYHAGTARLYSDVGILTCDDEIGADVAELFNYLTTGCKPPKKYRKILTSPKILKKEFIRKIRREAEFAEQGKPAEIRLKCNALEDSDVVRALYEASQKGVKIDLVIRDSCRLIPGIKGLSETISVRSILGEFLEHARVFHFRNGGCHEYYIGSADLMRRNLESRVELVIPIEGEAHQKELGYLFHVQLKDRRSAWELNSDGQYVQLQPIPRGRQYGAQQALIKRTAKRFEEAKKLNYRKPKGIASRA